jgi:hypothetical protein
MCYLMNAAVSEKLAAPRNFRLKRRQWGALDFLSEAHNGLSEQHFVRQFVDFGIKLCRMNNNQLPLLDQVRLQRALVHRANRDARRAQKRKK